ncbi:MAG: GntR family transcriptional regulator [Clostridiales bacterium]|jgi:DNA-binding transcriptional regulator YhcF (GntR family)|nr:GntR family transcriptional regulator [Clostridiales bacterium]
MKNFGWIQLNKHSGAPVYRQLGDALCELIETGLLKPHKKLPPIRTMARSLRINNDTVINAYKYLESKGVVYSVIGSGTYVAPLGASAEQSKDLACFRFIAYEKSKRRKPLLR